MKPAWDKLGDEYKSSKTVLIGDVDCTKEQDPARSTACRATPPSGTSPAPPRHRDSYNGGRDYDTLSKWAKDNLGPTCGAENIDLCDDEQKAPIHAKQKLSDADLYKEISTPRRS